MPGVFSDQGGFLFKPVHAKKIRPRFVMPFRRARDVVHPCGTLDQFHIKTWTDGIECLFRTQSAGSVQRLSQPERAGSYRITMAAHPLRRAVFIKQPDLNLFRYHFFNGGSPDGRA